MRSNDPLNARYVYPHVEIDLASCSAIYPNGQEVPIAGQSYGLLALVLPHPGRIFTYLELARELTPEYSHLTNSGRRRAFWDWEQIPPKERDNIKGSLQTLVHRTRRTLGEQPGVHSVIVNRMNLGYMARRPMRVTPNSDKDDKTPSLQPLR